MTDIKNILEQHVLWLQGEGGKCANLRSAELSSADLRGTNLSGADLSSADLRGTNLRGTNLRGTNLRHANLRGAELRSAELSSADLRYITQGTIGLIVITGLSWRIVLTSDTLAIGCQQHRISDWLAFSGEEIDAMDGHALEWWKINKDWIRSITDTVLEKSL